MTIQERILCELKGNLSYAETTGNVKEKEKCIFLINLVEASMDTPKESMCDTCDKGEMGSCFGKPIEVRNSCVTKCNHYKKEYRNDL